MSIGVNAASGVHVTPLSVDDAPTLIESTPVSRGWLVSVRMSALKARSPFGSTYRLGSRRSRSPNTGYVSTVGPSIVESSVNVLPPSVDREKRSEQSWFRIWLFAVRCTR